MSHFPPGVESDGLGSKLIYRILRLAKFMLLAIVRGLRFSGSSFAVVNYKQVDQEVFRTYISFSLVTLSIQNADYFIRFLQEHPKF